MRCRLWQWAAMAAAAGMGVGADWEVMESPVGGLGAMLVCVCCVFHPDSFWLHLWLGVVVLCFIFQLAFVALMSGQVVLVSGNLFSLMALFLHSTFIGVFLPSCLQLFPFLSICFLRWCVCFCSCFCLGSCSVCLGGTCTFAPVFV